MGSIIARLQRHLQRSDILLAFWLVLIIPLLTVIFRGKTLFTPDDRIGFAASFVYLLFAAASFVIYCVCLVMASARYPNDVRNAFAVYWSLLLGACEVLVLGVITFSTDRPKEIVIVFLFYLFFASFLAVTAARVAGYIAMKRRSTAALPSRFMTSGATAFLLVTALCGAEGIAYYLSLPFDGVKTIDLSPHGIAYLIASFSGVIPFAGIIYFFGIAVPRFALQSREERSEGWFTKFLVFLAMMTLSTIIMFVINWLVK